MNHKPNETMTHTHTHGPWELEHCRNEDGSKFITINGQGPHGVWLADIQAGDINGKPADVTEKHFANARLISSSPELMEALQMLMPQEPQEADSYDRAMWENARAAIAKANGDTATVWNIAAAAHREDRDNSEKRIACEQAMTAHHAAIAKATGKESA